jgi:hypothetical protein
MIDSIDELQKVVEQIHNCKAHFIKSMPILETFEEQIVWQGTVHIFDIQDNPLTNRCYAWSSPIEGSNKRRFYAVLNIPPVDSPEKAVRASIVHDYKTEK